MDGTVDGTIDVAFDEAFAGALDGALDGTFDGPTAGRGPGSSCRPSSLRMYAERDTPELAERAMGSGRTRAAGDGSLPGLLSDGCGSGRRLDGRFDGRFCSTVSPELLATTSGILLERSTSSATCCRQRMSSVWPSACPDDCGRAVRASPGPPGTNGAVGSPHLPERVYAFHRPRALETASRTIAQCEPRSTTLQGSSAFSAASPASVPFVPRRVRCARWRLECRWRNPACRTSPACRLVSCCSQAMRSGLVAGKPDWEPVHALFPLLT